jgi:hypothetical protein
MNTPHVPSYQQLSFALQTVIDNRRHAQNVVRWVKLRTLLLVIVAMLTTLLSFQAFSGLGDVPVPTKAVGIFAPIITAVLFFGCLWPAGPYFPGANNRSQEWQAGLGQNEIQSMWTLLQFHHDCLKEELRQMDLQVLLCFLPSAAAVVQMLASVGGWAIVLFFAK